MDNMQPLYGDCHQSFYFAVLVGLEDSTAPYEKFIVVCSVLVVIEVA